MTVSRAREPRPPTDPQGLHLLNEHVYQKFRWTYWCMKQSGQLFGAMVNQGLASEERLKQRRR